MLPFCGRSKDSMVKNDWMMGVSGVTGTLGKANSHFDPLLIGRLSSSFFCLFHACLCLLILLVLMSGDVHPNPGPIFPCSVCAGNVIWQVKSVQCCTCSKGVHLRCSLFSLSKFRTLGSSHSWSCPLCCVPACNTVTSTVTLHCNSVTSSSDSFDLYASTVQPAPSANAALPPHFQLQISYPPSAHSIFFPFAPSPLPLAPGCPSTLPAFSL